MHEVPPTAVRPAAIAFDLDGTLVDSIDDLAAAANHVRTSYGLEPLSRTVVQGYVGDGAQQLILRSLEHRSEMVREGLQRFRCYYGDHLLVHTAAYPGVDVTLRRLKQAGIPLAVVTNKPQTFVAPILKGLGLLGRFDAVVGARPGVAVKPDPALLRLALEETGIDPADWPRCWMVGDSPTDVGCGRSLGCRVLAVTYGLKDRQTLREAGAAEFIDAFAQLASLAGA